MRFWRRRRVMLDTNVIYSGIRYPKSNTAKIVDKALETDDLQITSVNYNECLETVRNKQNRQRKKGKSPEITVEEMRNSLDDIVSRTTSGEVKKIKLPRAKALEKMYSIRDKKDRKILYAAEKTGSEMLITGDKDFTEGLGTPLKQCMIVRPTDYREERRWTYCFKRFAWRLRK